MTHIIKKWFILVSEILILLATKCLAEHNLDPKNSPVASLDNDLTHLIDSTLGSFNAAMLIRNITDEYKNPCDDFYNFACGGYVRKNVIPKNRHSISPLYEIQMKIYQEIRKSLEENVQSNEPRIFKLAKNYYKACTDEANQNRGLKLLLQNLDALGGWPVLVGDSWNASQFDPYETDHKLRKLRYNPKSIFSIDVYSEIFDTSMNVLYFESPTGGVDAEFFQKSFTNRVLQAYYRYMVDVAVILGADQARAEEELRLALELERVIINAASSANSLDSLKIRKIEDLQKQVPLIPWLKYVNYLTEPIVTIEDYEGIHVDDLDYAAMLEIILSNTPKRIIANYMIWKTIAESIPYLTDELREKHFEFKKATSRKSVPLQKEPRWLECVKQLTDTENGLTIGVSSMYIRKHFTDNTRKSAEEIVSTVVAAFRDGLIKTSWLDKASKTIAIRKCDYMGKIIGYPNELLNDKTIDNYARNLDLSTDSHYENFLNLQRFHLDFKLSGLNKSPNDTMWTTFADSVIVNAYYFPIHNTLVLLAALLQPPTFNPNWPSYMRFGSIGFIVAHEIMHGYDTKGFRRDETGSLVFIKSMPSQNEYLSRLQCLADQYGGFTDSQTNLSVNGLLTLDENFADNGGLKIAHQAYQNWVSQHGEDPPLVAVGYSPDQLFWISAASFLCSKHSLESKMDGLVFSDHTPDDFRVVGMMRNSAEFARAFNCPSGAPMNPAKKCEIWR